MEWCKNDKHYNRYAKSDQRRKMGIASQRIQELKRLNNEPPIYHPVGRKFCGLIYSLNCQYELMTEQTILLFDTNNKKSYQAIVDGSKYDDRGGWHDWHELNAKAMQLDFLHD